MDRTPFVCQASFVHGHNVLPMRGRYAPSPTGHLHLGNARTALVAWLQARCANGAFVMRVEDLDRGRCRRPFEVDLLADLRWLGLDWDEGPDRPGSLGPYRQSERGERYADAIETLATYACTCSRREVRQISSAPHAMEPVYPGTCARGVRHPDRPNAVRWRVPAGVVEVRDLVAGTVFQDVTQTVGDFVLRRSDGAWAYQLAVVVDDAAMGVTDVVRGADLLDSTPRQVLLQRALGYPTPRYAHLPLVRGPDGEKLSKRHNAPDIHQLRTCGSDPHRVLAALARSLGLCGKTVRVVTAQALISDFDLAAIREDPDGLDIDALT